MCACVRMTVSEFSLHLSLRVFQESSKIFVLPEKFLVWQSNVFLYFEKLPLTQLLVFPFNWNTMADHFEYPPANIHSSPEIPATDAQSPKKFQLQIKSLFYFCS